MAKPLGHRVLVAVDKIRNKIGAIYLPEETKKFDQAKVGTATIIAIGETAWKSKKEYQVQECKVGDRVYISPYIGFKVYVKNDPDRIYKLVDDEDLLAIVEDCDETNAENIAKLELS